MNIKYSFNEEIQNILNGYHSLLALHIDKGMNSFDYFEKSLYFNGNYNSLFLLFRNIIAFADSISILVKYSAPEGIQPILRTLYEYKINLKYMLIDNIKRRSVNHQVYLLLREIDKFKKYDLNTKLGQKIYDKWKNDKLTNKIPFPNKDSTENICKILSQLNQYPFINSYTENKDCNYKNWFSFDKGPKNISELCEILNESMIYESFYGISSELVHGIDPFSEVIIYEQNTPAIEAFRSPVNIKKNVIQTLDILSEIYSLFFENILPEYYVRYQRYINNIYLDKKYQLLDNVDIEII